MVAQRIAVSGVADLKAKVLNFDNAVIVAAGCRGRRRRQPRLRRADAVAGHGGDLLADDRRRAEADVGAVHRARRAPLGDGARHRRPARRRPLRGGDPGGRAVDRQAAAAARRCACASTCASRTSSFTTFGKLPPIINAAGNVVVVRLDRRRRSRARRGQGAVGSGARSSTAPSPCPTPSKRPADGADRAAALRRRRRRSARSPTPSRCWRSRAASICAGRPQRQRHGQRLGAPAAPRRR